MDYFSGIENDFKVRFWNKRNAYRTYDKTVFLKVISNGNTKQNYAKKKNIYFFGIEFYMFLLIESIRNSIYKQVLLEKFLYLHEYVLIILSTLKLKC